MDLLGLGKNMKPNKDGIVDLGCGENYDFESKPFVLSKCSINYIIVIVIVLLLVLMMNGYLKGVSGCLKKITNNMMSSLNKLSNSFKYAERYSACPPSDCNNYKIRKDQMWVKNPFKFPWSGSDTPQYATTYEEINQTAETDFTPRTGYGETTYVNNCGQRRNCLTGV